MSVIYLNIDGHEVRAYAGQTVLEAARACGVEIPTLCHDKRVDAYGACGICVVEREGSGKLLRSCSTLAEDGMVVLTDTDWVRETRRTVLELLLSDHRGDCRPPCVLACPAGTDCQGYAGLIAEGEYSEALKLILEKIPLPGSIGRVCPHPCEEACRREKVEEPVSIAALKRFAADKAQSRDASGADSIYPVPTPAPATGKRVAIIGGGPGGLTAAYYLRLKGHAAVVYDSMPQMGGMLRYGIPEYRLPKDYLQTEINVIESLGVEFHNNIKIGKDLSLDWLRNNYDAVVVAVGASQSTGLRCPGEELAGVWGGIDFLRDVALGKPVHMGKQVAVVGGGNTAMDACRTAVRLGAEKVYCVYRRTRAEMPAEDIEIAEAEEEGVIFKYLTNPIDIAGDENGYVKSMRLQIMELGEPDASGRRAPVPVAGMEELLTVDTVISAIGQKLDPSGLDGVELTKWRTIAADKHTFRTNLPNVFAIGDATNDGASIAVEAIAEAGKAAVVIDACLRGMDISYENPYAVTSEPGEAEFAEYEKKPRVKMALESPAIRRSNFQELAYGLTEEQAVAEASRCLECGCRDYFECRLVDYSDKYKVKPEKYAGNSHHRPLADKHPLITRNPDKCILCGLCARVCDEVIGAGALGLLERGFDTEIKPALNLPLKESGCISCGQCVSICPTGALVETAMAARQVPLKEDETITVCAFCSVGCKMKLTHRGGQLLRALPWGDNAEQAGTVSGFIEQSGDGFLCVKGRFGFGELRKQPHLTKPLLRNTAGTLSETSYSKAYVEIVKRMQALGTLYGPESIGVSLSDRLTCEEILIIKEFAKEALHTENLFSFNRPVDGLSPVLGSDRSTAGLQELEHTDLILLVETDIHKPHLTAGLAVRKAVKNGATLIALNSFPSAADEIASFKALPGDDMSLLRGILKEALSISAATEKYAGWDELHKSLADVTPSDNAKVIAEKFVKAKKAVIVYEDHSLSPAASTLLANLAVIGGHAFAPRSGIVRLKANANGQGLADLGIKSASEVNVAALKGLLVFGEDIPALPQADFLAVQEVHMTATAARADVVLPAAAFSETDGLFVNSFNEISRLNAALPSPTGMSNVEQLLALSEAAGCKLPYRNVADVSGAFLRGRNTAQGQTQPRLQPVSNGPLKVNTRNTNALYNSFCGFLKSEGL
jgi:formate dehydrogenase major subunit